MEIGILPSPSARFTELNANQENAAAPKRQQSRIQSTVLILEQLNLPKLATQRACDLFLTGSNIQSIMFWFVTPELQSIQIKQIG